MDQQEFNNSILDFITGKLPTEKQGEFEQFILTHPESQERIEAVKQTWMSFDKQVVPDPSSKMDQTFYAFLDSESQNQSVKKVSLWGRINTFLDEASIQISAKQLAFGLAILALGVFIGSRLNQTTPIQTQLLTGSQAETEEIRSQLVMLLIDQPSASKRLQAVNEASKLNDVTELIVEALLKTLNNDPNANVRLASLESLVKYVNLPKVREGLATSITHQDSPLVQMALAELMVRLQEKGAIESMKKLLEQPEIDQAVKQKIEESILQI